MSDLEFVAAAYGIILGGVGLYAITLVRRLRRARDDVAQFQSNPGHTSTALPQPPAHPRA